MTATKILEDSLWELVESIWSVLFSQPVIRAHKTDSAQELSGMTACVQISGAFCGVVTLSMTDEYARSAAATMLAKPNGSLTAADIDDAVGEICNILGGGVKSLLPAPSTLSLPHVERKQTTANGNAAGRLTAHISFQCAGEPFEVRVIEEASERGPNETLDS
jgi:chemotaxis protein CheX